LRAKNQHQPATYQRGVYGGMRNRGAHLRGINLVRGIGMVLAR